MIPKLESNAPGFVEATDAEFFLVNQNMELNISIRAFKNFLKSNN